MIKAWAYGIIFLKAKKIPAVAATWLPTILTVPFIYPVQCNVGSLFLEERLSIRTCGGRSHQGFFQERMIADSSWISARYHVSRFSLEGPIFATISAVIGYFFSYGMIVRHREKKDQKHRIRLFHFD
jgi:uncharacterized protein (DUF2062 family)